MIGLPPGWKTTTLREIAVLITDGDHNPPKRVAAGVPHLTARNVRDGRFTLEGCTFISDDDFARTSKRYAPASGDVIVTCVGTLGETAIVPEEFSFSADRNLAAIRPREVILSSFLKAVLDSPGLQKDLRSGSGSTAQPHLYLGKLRELRIPLPPLSEQQRIVAAIEEQFSRLHAGYVALQRAKHNTAKIARSIILAAVPEDCPGHWKQVTVGDAGEVKLGRQRSPKYHNGPNMRPYLRVANVFEDRIDTSDIMMMHFEAGEFERYKLRSDDILLNEGQSPHLLGRPAMYRGEPPDIAFTNSLLRFRVGPSVLPTWALLVFRRHLHARRFMLESQITTNIAHLSAGRFKSVEFPIPPVSEQEDTVAQVEEKLSEVAHMAAAVDTQLARVKSLRASILAAAFSGRLA